MIFRTVLTKNIMYRNIKIAFFIGLFTCGILNVHSQNDTSFISNVNAANKGEIVMTKGELIDFLEKIASARKEVIEQSLDNSNLQLYGNNDYGAATVAAPFGAPIPLNQNLNTMSRNDLMREVQGLNARLNAMYGYGQTGAGNSTTFLTTPGNNQAGYFPYQTQAPAVNGIPLVSGNNTNGELRWKIDSLQRQVELLSAPAQDVEKQENIVKLKHELSQAQDSLIASSALTPEAKEIVKRYGSSEMKVYFDNDVSEVSSNFRSEVENAALVLKKNPQLGVVLKGFASPAGNPRYNYDLSLRRNEAVKRLLIDYGVFPDQISSVFYGEDKTTTANNARRVEIKFIIK